MVVLCGLLPQSGGMSRFRPVPVAGAISRAPGTGAARRAARLAQPQQPSTTMAAEITRRSREIIGERRAGCGRAPARQPREPRSRPPAQAAGNVTSTASVFAYDGFGATARRLPRARSRARAQPGARGGSPLVRRHVVVLLQLPPGLHLPGPGSGRAGLRLRLLGAGPGRAAADAPGPRRPGAGSARGCWPSAGGRPHPSSAGPDRRPAGGPRAIRALALPVRLRPAHLSCA